MKRGRAALRGRRWAEAEASFEAVLAGPDAERMTAVQRAEVLGQLGLCELEQRKHREAAEHLAKSLEQDAALNPVLLGKLTRAFDKAAEHVGQIYMAVSPPDAEILLDGRSLGTGASAHVLFVEPGIHTLRAQLSGHEDAHQILEVAIGQKQTAMMQLSRTVEAPRRAPAPEATAGTEGKSSGLVGGRPRDPGPWVSWPGKLRVAGIALTTATVSTGVVLMIRADRLNRDIAERIDGLNDSPTWTSSSCRPTPRPKACAELNRLRLDRDLAGRVGTGLAVAGGLVGAVTVASFFTDFSWLQPWRKQGTGLTVVPVTTAQQLGVLARGHW